MIIYKILLNGCINCGFKANKKPTKLFISFFLKKFSFLYNYKINYIVYHFFIPGKMSNGFQACYIFLQNKHIRIQKEWLEACIEWIIEENGVYNKIIITII